MRLRRRQPGPAVENLDPETIRICEGRLDGQVLQLRVNAGPTATRIELLDAERPVGHCEFETRSAGREVDLWFVSVEPRWQGNGLAALMIRTGLRRMLELSRHARFSMRMVQLLRTSGRTSSLHNLGMGILAHRFGYEPADELVRLLRREHIQGIEFVEGQAGEIGYRILLNCYPAVMVAVQLDPETSEPYHRDTMLQYCGITPEMAESWAFDPNVILGNGDYVLRQRGVSRLIDAVAETTDEAIDFVRRINGW
jgi:GNAT superfamily N-acetyltransferase